MQRFVLKKLFDIRPLNKKGELNLGWILKAGKTIKLKKKNLRSILIDRNKEILPPIPTQRRGGQDGEKTNCSPSSESFSTNYPAWEDWRGETIKENSDEYEYREIRQAIMDELEEMSLKEDRLKQEFGPPVNLPMEKEAKREKNYKTWLKKISPQIINLRIKFPQFPQIHLTPSLKYILASIALMILVIPSVYVLFNINSTKDLVLTSGNQGYENLLAAQEALFVFQPDKSAENFRQARENFNNASKAMNKLGGSLLNVVDVFPLRYKVGAGKKLLAAGKAIAQSGTYLTKGLSIINELSIEDILKENDNTELNSGQLMLCLKGFKQEFLLAQEELARGVNYLKEIKAEDLPQQYRDEFNSLATTIPYLENNLSKFDNFLDLFLDILGNESPRHYLVLFQNNSELRATGGFIGSYALLSVSNGQVEKIEVKNIFDADGQLIVNVVPPKPIQKISSGWSTHDANWFFDFPTSAEKIAWFFEKTGGPTVDGIIALTPQIIEKILTILGPINLLEYNLIINETNFVNEVQYKVEKDYDPYLNEPKKILADFTTSLFEKFVSLPKEKWPPILGIFNESLKNKDLIFWLKNKEEENFIIDQGWSGKITKTDNDYLAIVHSNVNGYKTDRFMKEDIRLAIDIKNEKELIHHLTIVREHTGGNEMYEWYNKVNSDYLRVYLPKGSEIISASGSTPEDTIVPPLDYELARFRRDDLVASIEATLEKRAEFNIDIFKESDKTVVGAWLYTSPGEQTVFELTYKVPEIFFFKSEPQLPLEGSSHESINYNLVFQKQPGSYNAPLRMTIDYPDNWRIKQVYPRDKLTSQTPIRFREILNMDKVFNINFKIENF
jgi:hypothetical protein